MDEAVDKNQSTPILLEGIDHTLGLNRLMAIHLNDSKTPFNLETPNDLSGYETEIKNLREAWL